MFSVNAPTLHFQLWRGCWGHAPCAWCVTVCRSVRDFSQPGLSGYMNWYGGGLSRHPPLKCVTQRAAVRRAERVCVSHANRFTRAPLNLPSSILKHTGTHEYSSLLQNVAYS